MDSEIARDASTKALNVVRVVVLAENGAVLFSRHFRAAGGGWRMPHIAYVHKSVVCYTKAQEEGGRLEDAIPELRELATGKTIITLGVRVAEELLGDSPAKVCTIQKVAGKPTESYSRLFSQLTEMSVEHVLGDRGRRDIYRHARALRAMYKSLKSGTPAHNFA